jgi:hypothetical protein
MKPVVSYGNLFCMHLKTRRSSDGSISQCHLVYQKSHMNWSWIESVPLVIQPRSLEVTQFFEIIGFSKFLFLPVSKHQLFFCCKDRPQLSSVLRCVLVGPSVCSAIWWLDLWLVADQYWQTGQHWSPAKFFQLVLVQEVQSWVSNLLMARGNTRYCGLVRGWHVEK